MTKAVNDSANWYADYERVKNFSNYILSTTATIQSNSPFYGRNNMQKAEKLKCLKDIGAVFKEKEETFRSQYNRIFVDSYDEGHLLEILDKFTIEDAKTLSYLVCTHYLKIIKQEDISPMMKYNANDPYVFNPDVRIRTNLDTGEYQYVIESVDLCVFVNRVLTRSYYRYELFVEDNGEVCITTNCDPDAFKMVYERALMEKNQDETGVFTITANEEEDDLLKEEILRVVGEKSYAVYNPRD